jgi:hypothetical protein
LFTELAKINPTLALQVSSATSAATGINLIATAYENAAKAGNLATASAIARAAMGRSSGAAGPALLGSIANAGGLQALGVSAQQAGDIIDPGLIARLTALQTQLDLTKTHASDAFSSLFSEDILGAELQTYSGLAKIVSVLKELSDSMGSVGQMAHGVGPALLSMLGPAGILPAYLLSKSSAPSSAFPTVAAPTAGQFAGAAALNPDDVASWQKLEDVMSATTPTAAALYAVMSKTVSALPRRRFNSYSWQCSTFRWRSSRVRSRPIRPRRRKDSSSSRSTSLSCRQTYQRTGSLPRRFKPTPRPSRSSSYV